MTMTIHPILYRIDSCEWNSERVPLTNLPASFRRGKHPLSKSVEEDEWEHLRHTENGRAVHELISDGHQGEVARQIVVNAGHVFS